MATLTIRDVDDDLKARLRVRAAEHGRSMEAEVRAILHDTLMRRSVTRGLGTRIHHRFSTVDGAGLEQPARHERPRTADL